MPSTTVSSILSIAAFIGAIIHLATIPLNLDFRIWTVLKSYSIFLLSVFSYSLFSNVYSALNTPDTYALKVPADITVGNIITVTTDTLSNVTTPSPASWASTAFALLLRVPLNALAVTALVAGAFNVGFVVSMIIYRWIFHRLSLKGFPGPWQFKVSRFYNVWVASRSGLQYFLNLQAWHEKYGDVVRTGPRDLSIRRASAVQAIYGPHSRCAKSNWYGEPTDKRKSLQTTRNPEIHKRRRRIWDQAFNAKALSGYLPRVTAKADLLMAQLSEREGEPVNISKWMMFFSFDVMGDLGFGKDFHMLEKGEEDEAAKVIHKTMTALGLMHHVIWLPHFLLTVPGLATSTSRFRDWCEERVIEKQQNWDPEASPTDIMSFLLKDNTSKDESTGEWKAADPAAMAEDSKLIIIAGSDTTSSALAHAVYFLITNPEVYSKLQSILDPIFPAGDIAWNYDAVKSIPYLDAIIYETLRLKPPVPTGIHRQTPKEGLQIDELFIPGDVHVAVPTYTLHRDKRYWERADEWLPERWLGAAAERIVPDAFIPFSVGPYSCIGKVLSLMEQRIVLSRLALRYNLALAPGETGEDFDRNVKDNFTFAVRDLQVVLTKRA